MGEYVFMETMGLRNISIAEESEDSDTDPEPSGGDTSPPVDNENAEPASSGGDQLQAGDAGQTDPSKPVPKPRSPRRTSDILPPVPSLPSPSPASPRPSPAHAALTPSPTAPEPLYQSPSAMRAPPPPPIAPPPPAPPLPFRMKSPFKKARTKAFHWDVVGSEKVKLLITVQYKAKKRISSVGISHILMRCFFFVFLRGQHRKDSFSLVSLHYSSLHHC